MKKLVCGLFLITIAAQAQSWDTLVDRYFDQAVLRFNPTNGTQWGFHEYDTKLEDFSKATITRNIGVLKDFEKDVAAFPTARLSPQQLSDREIVLANIRSSLLTLETIRPWEKNPDTYSSTASATAFSIMSRSFAPPADRLRSLIAREKQMPALFVAARANLKNPPKIYTEIALEQLPGNVNFFRNDVPEAFKDVTDASLLAEFRQANQNVIRELEAYGAWMKSSLLPHSGGDFRIGAATYRRKLAYDEMVDIPLDRLLAIGFEDLHRNQEQFKEVARRIDPARTAHQILVASEKDHPAPGNLLDTFRDTLAGLRDFIEQHHIVRVPSQVMPILEETPPFMRATTFASMDTPGPYEKVAKEAYFNVTLPEKSWTPEQVEEHMAGFNRGTIISTAVHEVFPGHYLQFLWVPDAPSKVSKLLGASSNAEGWAHYSEQMMLDEGYGNGDLKLRLGQLQDALLRDARYIVGIQMHTGKMSYEQAIDFFEKEGYQTRLNGERETRRGTSDPTYLYYTLGKLEILKLRDDYKKMKGDAFSLEDFHTRFLQQGFPPIKIVRRALLGNDSPVLQ